MSEQTPNLSPKETEVVSFRPINIQVPENFTTEEKQLAERLNNLMGVVYQAQVLADYDQHHLLTVQNLTSEGSASPLVKQKQDHTIIFENLRNSFVPTSRNIGRDDPKKPEEAVTENDDIQEEYENILIENPAELLFLYQCFNLFHHDMATPLTSMRAGLQIMDRRIKAGALETLDQQVNLINRNTGRLAEVLKIPSTLARNRYPQDTLQSFSRFSGGQNFEEVMDRNFAAALKGKNPPIEVVFNSAEEDFFDRYEAAWSYLWLGVAWNNAAQNIERAYDALDELYPDRAENARTAFVDLRLADRQTLERVEKLSEERGHKYGLDPDKAYAMVTIEDRATGYLDSEDGYNIGKQGYRLGKTSYGQTEVSKHGTGTAMALISDISKDKYGVIFHPEDAENDKGIKIGARTIVFIPLKSTS